MQIVQVNRYPEWHHLRKEDISDKMLEPCNQRRYGMGSNLCNLHAPHCCERVFADFVCPRGMDLIFICPDCGKDVWSRQDNDYPVCKGCGRVMMITYGDPEAKKKIKERSGKDSCIARLVNQ